MWWNMCLVSFESWELILQFISSGLTKLDETIGNCWCPIVMRWSLWLQQWSILFTVSIYSGPDSNACSLLWIKHATSRDVVTANRLWKLHVNSIIAHVTKYVICAYPARKWLNFASIFTDHSSAREIILTIALSSSGNKFRYVVVYLYVFAVYTDWYSDFPHGTDCFL